jgi:hypothetical protein
MNNKKIMGLLLLAIVAVSAQAQDSYIKGRWNAKLGYSSYPQLGFKLMSDIFENYTPTLKGELNYGFFNNVEFGAYAGYSVVQTGIRIGGITSNQTGQAYGGQGASVAFYGVSANYQFLPHWVDSKDYRFDLYLSGKLGGLYRFTKANAVPERGHQTDYGIYAGSAFYLKKHLGLFAEVGYGNFTNLRYGLTWKW